MDAPLSVAVAAVFDGDRVLCIKRERGDYQGQWALPGGKIEADEHLPEAAVREVREEAGIETVFDTHAGVVSEHLVTEEGQKHFMLHICRLTPAHTDIVAGEEGELAWFSKEDIGDDPDDSPLVPSDYEIVSRLFDRSFARTYSCRIDERDDEQRLVYFSDTSQP